MRSIIALSVLALATAINGSPVNHVDKKQDSDSVVNAYSVDSCTGTSSGFTVVGSGAYRCYTFPDARSIQVSGGGCATVAWTGSNCQGDSYLVPDSSCHSVLFAAVSVQC